MEYTTKKVISHGVLDPNVCVEIDGRLYRKIATVRPEDNGRWAKTGEFMRTPECQRLIEEGLLVPRSRVPVQFDGCDHYEVERIPFFTHLSQWTSKQFAAVIENCCRVNMVLESAGSIFRATDCHYYNVMFRHDQPLYVDFGSFSTTQHNGVRSHIRMSLRSRSWDEALCPDGKPLEEVIKDVNAFTPLPNPTEWDTYDGRPGPDTVGEVKPNTNEEKLLSQWIEDANPSSLIDIGGNSGTMARMIAAKGINVLSVDVSEIAANQNWMEARRLKLPITSICDEFQGLSECHKADMAFGSSVTHHLIRSGLSFEDQAKKWDTIAERFLMVEFIDPSDKCLKEWGSIPGYTKQDFLDSLSGKWKIMEVTAPNEPERIWFLFVRK